MRAMQRVPLAEFEPALKKRLEKLWSTPPNLYRALGNHPQLTAAWTEFARALRYDARTPRALRELVILRGTQLMRSEYEWAPHLVMARKSGVRESQIEDLSSWIEPAMVAAFYAMVGRMLDAMGVPLEPEMQGYSPRLA
jgi:alkylhydroperoxidase family enzyme